MPGGHVTTFEVSNIMSFVLYTQILKQSVLKPASAGITLNYCYFPRPVVKTINLLTISNKYPYASIYNGKLGSG